MTEQPRLDHIMQVGLGFWAAKALLSAVEMELFTELAKHPEDLATLQGRLGLHPRGARDFLDALVALKLLERHPLRKDHGVDGEFFGAEVRVEEVHHENETHG